MLLLNLTLTNVVFEFSLSTLNKKFFGDLTLTNVVFESAVMFKDKTYYIKFNFNKCCI